MEIFSKRVRIFDSWKSSYQVLLTHDARFENVPDDWTDVFNISERNICHRARVQQRRLRSSIVDDVSIPNLMKYRFQIRVRFLFCDRGVNFISGKRMYKKYEKLPTEG